MATKCPVIPCLAIGRSKDEFVDWVECEICFTWHHSKCVGIDTTLNNPDFICRKCLVNKSQAKSDSETLQQSNTPKPSAKTRKPSSKSPLTANLTPEKFNDLLRLSSENTIKSPMFGNFRSIADRIRDISLFTNEQLVDLRNNISTNLQKCKEVSNFWPFVYNLRRDDVFIRMWSNALFAHDETITQQHLHVTQVFLQNFFTLLETYVIPRENQNNVSEASGTKESTMTLNELRGFRHTAGSIIYKLLLRAKLRLSSNAYETLYAALKKERADDETEDFTEIISRDGLTYITNTTFDLFKRLHTITNPFYENISCFQRLRRARELIKDDTEVKAMWYGLVGSSSDYNTIFENLVAAFLTNRGNLLAKIVRERILMEDMKKKKEKEEKKRSVASNDKRGLRKKLKNYDVRQK